MRSWYNSLMNYELAKQLKDAGFPQNPANRQVHTAICGNFDKPDPECRSENRGVAPTLEELIEATPVVTLAHFQRDELDYWWADALLDAGLVEGKGSTPTEAVANLWLALNKVQ